MTIGQYFCTACGLCSRHHVGPLCMSEPDYPCAWDPMGFDLREVIRSAGTTDSHIHRRATAADCPYCRWDRPLMLDMSRRAMTFTEGMWERARNSALPS